MLKRSKITFLMVITCILLAGLFIYHPTFATESSDVTETVFFGNVEDDGSACGVFTVLNLVVDILSIGIGILGVIGITVVGIKYLTAKDNEEQTRKAKHRMTQIVIGLATAALLYAGLQFLLPGGKLSFTTECKTMSDQDLQKIKDKEKAEQEKAAANSGSNSKPNSSSGSGSKSKSSSSASDGLDKNCLKNALKDIRNEICRLETGSERIARTAELLAFSSKEKSRHHYPNSFRPKKWSQFYGTKPNKYFQNAYDRAAKNHFKKNGQYALPIRTGASCDRFVGTVVHASGYDKKFTVNHDSMRSRMNGKKTLWKKVKKEKRGDICQKYFGNGGAHIKIYLGHKRIAEASSGVKSGDKRFGGVTSGNCSGYDIYRAIK